MPLPVFRGVPATEIQMPAKPVYQHECERCKRTWLADTEKQGVRVLVDIQLPGMEPICGSYSMLCDACEKTCAASATVILKALKKQAPSKSGAKEKTKKVSSKRESNDELTLANVSPAAGQERTSAAAKLRSGSSDPSTPQ